MIDDRKRRANHACLGAGIGHDRIGADTSPRRRCDIDDLRVLLFFEIVFEKGVLRIANIISDLIYTKKIVTDELCTDDICVSKEQLKALLIQAGGTTSPGNINTSDPITEPEPDSASSPQTTPEEIPTEEEATPPAEEPAVEPTEPAAEEVPLAPATSTEGSGEPTEETAQIPVNEPLAPPVPEPEPTP